MSDRDTDYIKTGISLASATLANLRRLLPLLLPYLSLLFAFTIFVLWNGGVVLGMYPAPIPYACPSLHSPSHSPRPLHLSPPSSRLPHHPTQTKPPTGDKTNHHPHLHLPQLLYLAPYTALFSFPLYYPYLLNLLPPHLIPPSRRTGPTRHLLPRLSLTLPLLGLFLLIVRHNTLIHPFTLADNRHYTFYVFRHLRRHWSLIYAPVPLYFITAWCCIVALGGYPVNNAHTTDIVERENEKEEEKEKEKDQAGRRAVPPGTCASFLLLHLATTALSVVTAPLVEPRYFILPWMVWRLHVPRESGESGERSERSERREQSEPTPQRGERTPAPQSGRKPKESTSWLARHGYDYRLHLETVWFLLVNGATGYVFLAWGFTWPLEGGVQRFMW